MERVTSADGTTLAVYEFGGTGPTLLLAHATGFHAHVWLPVVERLTDRFRCVGFDQRAHGDSDPPADGVYDWHRLGVDTLAVIDGLSLERPLGVGHSSGAAALLLAEEQRAGVLRGIWGYEPIVPPIDEPMPLRENPMSEAARRRREVFESRDAAFANYAAKPPFDRVDPAALRAYVDYGFDDLPDGTVRLKCRGANEARFYESQAGHHAYRDLAKVRCPVTLVRGEAEGFPASFIDAVAARLMDVRTETLEGRGHFGPLEDPGAVADSISRAFATAT